MKKIRIISSRVPWLRPFSTSCNDSDGDYPRLSAFATVKPLENNDFFVVLDDGRRCTRATKSRIGSYKAEEAQRVIIYFNLLNNKVEGYDYNMALYYIQDINSGGTKVVTTQEELDALEDDKTSFKDARLNNNYSMSGSGSMPVTSRNTPSCWYATT